MVTMDDYLEIETEWCPGCGNFAILKAIKKALVNLGKEPREVLIVSGIGQAGKLPHYMKCNTFNGLHGRTLPPATGAKIANHELTVLTVGGDGDAYGEGGNHIIHAIRRNPNITTIVNDNQIYGLTKGQASPTSELGMKTKVQTYGVVNTPLNPLALAISLDCSFVARGYAGNIEHLTGILEEAINHRGFALVDILQPCVSFNKLNTFKWYAERVYRLDEEGYVPNDRITAFERSLEWGDKIPIGIFYKKEKTTLEDGFSALKEGTLISRAKDHALVDELIDSFM
ncbi:2-oxoacid:ferredoxin oxidoreductase subunit beta [uncultured Methanomethylovorans sp.]|uniref:2-oxoacid:ferredoxin oxidoreductase subunit beta n=1 Tax=uncultured Methanomethylovorans sp. TaxID=183759 RepID=UPI002AA7D17B|nr:2-oxoacid:ferredoxin oxidoreductase subunit beta [uncultured Methanomethylovorans sp.]